jgi:hypothetical protein
MLSRYLLLAFLVLQSHATSLRIQPMSTYVPKPIPHMTVLPTDIIYVPIPQHRSLYHIRGSELQ